MAAIYLSATVVAWLPYANQGRHASIIDISAEGAVSEVRVAANCDNDKADASQYPPHGNEMCDIGRVVGQRFRRF